MGPESADDAWAGWGTRDSRVLATRNSWDRLCRGLLLVGYTTLAGAIIVAHRTPATGYEVSIYRSTPVLFWAGTGTAFLLSLLVSMSRRRSNQYVAAFLGGVAFMAVATLPLLRGYHFYGPADGLVHLGYVMDLQNGALSPFSLFYPALHLSTIGLSTITGDPLPRSLLSMVAVTLAVFVVFVPLLVRNLTDRPDGLVIGAFTAFLLLPINHIATHYLSPHTMSQAILLFPLALFLLVRYVRSPAGMGEVTETGVLLGLVSIATVLYHPMQATVLIGLFVATSMIQFGYRSFGTGHPIADHKPLYWQTVLLITVFVLWAVPKPVFTGTAELVLNDLRTFVFQQQGGGEVVGQRLSSLRAAGGTPLELFVKLFPAAVVLIELAGILILRSILGPLNRNRPELAYLGGGLVLLTPVSLAFFVGNSSKLFFRFFGSAMVLVTVLGAVQLLVFYRMGSRDSVRNVVRLSVTVGLAVLLCLSLLTVFTSPYIYKPNRQVTAAQMTGYDTAFAHGEAGVRFGAVRSGPDEYLAARYGTESVPPSMDPAYHGYADAAGLSGANLTDIGDHYRSDHYVVLTTADIERELSVYRGLRYSRSQFRAVGQQRDVHLVQSNGEFRMYRYDSRAATTRESTGPRNESRAKSQHPAHR
jgi:hypothetical protein